MANALLCLNDINLRWLSQCGVETAAVGAAYHRGQGVDCGARAWSSLWLEPQHCYSQYWQQFNQNALAPQKLGVRHHADLVFHQLQQLQRMHLSRLAEHSETADEQLLICPPSHFRDQELALLLAVTQSLQLPVANFVDTAVAAVAAADTGTTQRLIYVDMQLHQTQLIEIVARDGHWFRGIVTPLGDCGLLALLNSAAHFLADRFIDEHRFDPLKQATSSQYLYDLIATELLYRGGDFSLELESRDGRLNCTIDGHSWRQVLVARLDTLLQSVGRGLGQDAICLHSNSQWLQSLFDQAAPLLTVTDQQISENLFQHWPSAAATGPVLIDALQRRQVSQPKASSKPQPASHLLFDNIAYALGDGLWFTLEGQDLLIHHQCPSEPLLALTIEQHKARLCWHPSYAQSLGLAQEQLLAASPGTTITVHQQQLTLIALAASGESAAVASAAAAQQH